MRGSPARQQTLGHTTAPGSKMMHTATSRSARADQLHAEVRDADCCDVIARCAGCRAKLDEVRAARRDALIHSVTSVRPRRAVL